MKRAASFLYIFLALSLTASHTLAGQIQGYVYTRSFALSESGNKIWAEYDPATGQLVREIGEAVGALSPREWRALSGVEYRGYISQYEQVRGNYPPDLASQIETISRTDYESRTFYLADGQTEVSHKPDLRSTTAYVSIRPQSTRLLDDGSQIILAQYPVNPLEPLGNEVTSMLLKYTGSGIGEVKNQTANRIGFKTGFITDEAGNALDVPVDFGEGYSRKPGQSVLGPIANAQVEALAFGKGVTGEDGRYVAQWYSIPCPLYHYIIDGAAHVNLRYRRFNPKSSSRGGIYFLSRPVAETCQPDVFIPHPLIGPWPLTMGHATTHPHTVDFPVDVMVVSGTAELRNAPVGAMTQYGADEPDTALTGIDYDIDLDNDGQPDTVVLGHLLTDADGDYVRDEQGRVQFMPGEGGDPRHQRQGVYFSSSGEAAGQPDVIRVMDRASFSDTSHQGLLTQISEEDLRNTDIYLVRVSDGKLIAERIGLSASEADPRSDLGADAGNSRFFYTLQMRNSFGDAYRTQYGQLQAIGRDFDKWQSTSGINPQLHARQADHLQPGDQVRIIAINRATGYIGSTITEMKPAGSAGSDDLSFQIDPIVMGPPNLEIWAERGYNIQAGLQAGEFRKDQIIGFEGASLTSDAYVKLYTRWLDHNGSPLPEALAGAGYTGRIAILSGDKTLPNGNQGVYHFAIDPGEHIQVLQLPNNLVTDAQHYYVQVSGEPEGGNPIFTGAANVRVGSADFTSTGTNPGILQKRPNKYVPFKVPVFDERATELQRQNYRQIKRDNPDLDLENPKPVYSWVYRPEFQFSSYQLEMQAVFGETDANEDGTIQDDERVDLLSQGTPTLSRADGLSLLYNLTTTSLLPLDYFNAGEHKELVFVLGEAEFVATIGEDQQLHFSDLSHLAQLSPEDFMTLRLYANNDMGNVLWEFAFSDVAIFPEAAETSADFHAVELVAFASFPEDEVGVGSIAVRWEVIGAGGSFEQAITESATGIFTNTLNTSTQADSSYSVRLTVIASSVEAVAVGTSVTAGPYRVVPGLPAHVSLEADNPRLLTTGTDSTTITATVRDQFQNLVADGTPVSWSSDYSGLLTDEQLITNNGTVTAKYQSGYENLGTTVSVAAGVASGTYLVAKEAFDYSISASSLEIAVGTAQTVRVEVTTSATPEEPIPVLWETTHGRIEGTPQLEGTTVSATLYPADIPGDGIVTVNIAGVRKSIAINHLGNSVGTVRFDYAAIVGGPEGGSGTVETLRGTTNSYAHVTSTQATVYGIPGTTYTLAAGGFYTPNSEPLVHLAMNEIVDDGSGQLSVYEMRSGLDAVVSGPVTVDDTESYTLPGSSLLFEGGSLRVPPTAILNADDDIYVNLRFRTSSSYGDQILVRKATNNSTGFELRLIKNGGELYLQGSVETDQGTFITVVDTAVKENTWYIAGLRIRNGQLEIGLDGERSQVAFTGTPLTGVFGSALEIGKAFIGHIDEVKYGHDTIERALVLVDGGTSSTVAIGADGTATINVNSSGRGVTGSTRVGFSGTFVTQTGQVETRELHVAQRMLSRLTGLPQVERSFAETSQQVNEYEDGLAVVNSDDFAHAAEMMMRAGSVVYDTIKSALAFLYEISGFADIVTITRAIITWIDDGWEAVDKLDLVFAGIGLTLSIVAIVTAPTGAGTVAALSAKTALRALRSILKELVTDPVTLLKAGGTVVRWTFDLMKQVFTGNPGQAVRQLSDLGDAIIRTVSDATGKTIMMFAALVRSTKDLTRFLLLFRISKEACAVPVAANGVPYGPQYARFYDRSGLFLAYGLLGFEAQAAQSSLCGQALEHAVADAVKLVRTTEDRRVFNTIVDILDPLASTGKLGVNERTLKTLARLTDAGHGEQIRMLLKAIENNALVTRAGENTTTIDDLMSTAVVRNKATGDVIPSMDTAFDEFVKVLEELENIPDPAEAAKMIGHLKPTKTRGQITAYQYKRVYGELRSLQIIRADPEYAGATLRSIDDTVLDDYFAARTGSPGVDSIWELENGATLFAESKNWGAWARTGASKAEFLARLDKQFIKHVQENLVRGVRRTADGRFYFPDDERPILLYINSGGFFVDDLAAPGVYNRFKELLSTTDAEGFQAVRQALGHGTETFDENLSKVLRIMDDEKLVPPFST